MKILIDGTTLCARDGGVGAGIEHYTWSILFSLFRLNTTHEFLLVVPSILSEQRVKVLLEGVSHVKVLRMPNWRVPFFSRHIFLPFRILLNHPDIVFSPSGQLPLGCRRGKYVLTVHDVLIYQHPEWFDESQKKDFSTRIVVPVSFDRAGHIVAVSNATQEALNKLFPVTINKTSVVYEGVGAPSDITHSNFSDRFPFDRDYVLFIGTVEPRKNLLGAFQAFHTFLESRPEQASEVRLIVAGKKGWHTDEIEQMLISINQYWSDYAPKGVIQMLGPVTEEEKWNLLSRASCLLFPSLAEGFGLPVLEAMSVGTPVITTRLGALPEVGGDAAIYIEPDDIEGMSLAITQCLLVPEGVKTLREEGRKRAAFFTWERAAEEMLKVFEKTAYKNDRVAG